jgi:hypothetical protein
MVGTGKIFATTSAKLEPVLQSGVFEAVQCQIAARRYSGTSKIHW